MRAAKSADICIYRSPEGDIPFTLTHRYRQKHINIRISHGGEVKVSAPASSSMARVLEAIASKELWVRSHISRMGALLDAFDPNRTVLYRGNQHSVNIVKDPSRAGTVRRDPDRNVIRIHTRSPETVAAEELIGRWLKREARSVIRGRVDEISKAIGIPIQRLFLRDQRARWGSSSSKGNISLNWRAIMLPEAVADYLIIHELTHQRSLDHSKRFWSLVAELCPDFRKHEAYLKHHSTLLALFR